MLQTTFVLKNKEERLTALLLHQYSLWGNWVAEHCVHFSMRSQDHNGGVLAQLVFTAQSCADLNLPIRNRGNSTCESPLLHSFSKNAPTRSACSKLKQVCALACPDQISVYLRWGWAYPPLDLPYQHILQAFRQVLHQAFHQAFHQAYRKT